MKIRCYDITWDNEIWQDGFPKGFYSVEQILDALPNTIILELPDKQYDDLEIADYITDLTGILVEAFSQEVVETDRPATRFTPIGPWHQDKCPTWNWRDKHTKYVVN